MRYNISCCKYCEVRYPGCSCAEYLEQKRELIESKEMCRQAKTLIYNTNSVEWASQQSKRAKFY